MTANATAFIRANRRSSIVKSRLLNDEKRPKIGVEDRAHIRRCGHAPRWAS